MKKITFVTSNPDKFQKAQVNLLTYDLELVNKKYHFLELQSEDGREIARYKAEQAYQALHTPVLVNDDTWSVSALRGFPSTSMKQCNYFLRAEDWLRLMKGVKDRRATLTSYYAYHNGQATSVVSYVEERHFLPKARGQNKVSPFLEVVAKKGSATSIAEDIVAGRYEETNQLEFWQKLAQLLKES